MLQRIKVLILNYLFFLLIFVFQKPLFLIYHWEQSLNAGLGNCLKVISSGFPMDLSMAGYCTVIPLLLLLFSFFIPVKYLSGILKTYYILIDFLIALVFIPDLELYSYWGFRIDSTIFTYIVDPVGAAASVSAWIIVALVLIVLAYTFLQYLVLKPVVREFIKIEKRSGKFLEAFLLIITSGLIFIAIRGGVTTSTMNVGRVYFSESMYLNHAAINPVFNMFFSIKLKENFASEYRFMEDCEAHRIFDDLMAVPSNTDTIPLLLNTNRPNIIFVMLESFGAVVMESQGGYKDVAPNLSKLSEESVFFNNLYANSFRTDRGLVAALGGYPAQPTMSILKYPKKAQSLTSIPKVLSQNGYKTSFLYGGDVSFAYIKSFLVAQMITDITQDTDFPISERMNKWGASDHVTCQRFFDQIRKEEEKPYFKIFLTLSSHEPFDVPFHKFEDPYLNSIAYTDSCLGVFINKMKLTPEWENTLLVFVPDHDMRYPDTVPYNAPNRHDIFMIWAGGAIKSPMIINHLGSQTDIAATLLYQLGIDHSEFPFSKNLLDSHSPQFAFYDFPNGLGFLSPEGKLVYDCGSNAVILEEGEDTTGLLLKGEAFLQCLYDDIDRK